MKIEFDKLKDDMRSALEFGTYEERAKIVKTQLAEQLNMDPSDIIILNMWNGSLGVDLQCIAAHSAV